MATRGWWTVPVLMIALLCTGCSALDNNALSIRSHGYGDAGRGPAVVSHPLAVHIGSGDVVQVGGPGRTQIVIADPSKGLAAGFSADVTLSFAKAGTTTVGIVVDAPRDYLAPCAPPSTLPPTKPSTPVPSTPPPNIAQRA